MMKTNNEDAELDKLVSRVEFYESCVDQLKKDIPKYLNKMSDLEKYHKSMAKAMRNVASSEPNRKLQNVIFLYAQKQDVMEKQALSFNSSDKLVSELINDSLKLLVAPIKEVISDQKKVRKISPSSQSVNSKSQASEPASHQFVKSTLQVHAKLFEKHRVVTQKKLFQTLVVSELRYHCKAVEELSAVVQELSTVQDDD